MPINPEIRWRLHALAYIYKRRRPRPDELVTMRRRYWSVWAALMPVKWHRADCLCYGCYL